jgi:predicted PurR-regulated permease PerM
MSIYIAIRLFGFIGIILGPIIVISILALQKMGIIPTLNPHIKNEK